VSVPDATAVHQLAESLDWGDGVSGIVRRTASILAAFGEPAAILSCPVWVPDELRCETQPPAAMLATPAPGLVFHYWGYNSCTWMLDATPARKAIWYHNITPPRFFTPELPQHWMTRQGYVQLSQIASRFDLLIGDSQHNLAALVPYLRRPRPAVHVYPIVEPAAERAAAVDGALRDRLVSSAGTKLLFIGRVARNKRHEELLRAFDVYRRRFDPTAQLWLVGNDQCDPPYRAELETLRRSLPSGEAVTFTGKVSDLALRAHLLAADVFVCASEHEGFCIPIAQAMALDVPVVARATAAVPETLGDGGMLLPMWDPGMMAEAIFAVRPGGPRRDAVLAHQRVAVTRFSAAAACERIEAVVRFLRTGEVGACIQWLAPRWYEPNEDVSRGLG
jgi:glycosyltransferase involved in cell wall biosynthesis